MKVTETMNKQIQVMVTRENGLRKEAPEWISRRRSRLCNIRRGEITERVNRTV